MGVTNSIIISIIKVEGGWGGGAGWGKMDHAIRAVLGGFRDIELVCYICWVFPMNVMEIVGQNGPIKNFYLILAYLQSETLTSVWGAVAIGFFVVDGKLLEHGPKMPTLAERRFVLTSGD